MPTRPPPRGLLASSAFAFVAVAGGLALAVAVLVACTDLIADLAVDQRTISPPTPAARLGVDLGTFRLELRG